MGMPSKVGNLSQPTLSSRNCAKNTNTRCERRCFDTARPFTVLPWLNVDQPIIVGQLYVGRQVGRVNFIIAGTAGHLKPCRSKAPMKAGSRLRRRKHVRGEIARPRSAWRPATPAQR